MNACCQRDQVFHRGSALEGREAETREHVPCAFFHPHGERDLRAWDSAGVQECLPAVWGAAPLAVSVIRGEGFQGSEPWFAHIRNGNDNSHPILL